MLTIKQKKKLKISLITFGAVVILFSGSFFYYEKQKAKQPKTLNLEGIVEIGAGLNPPRDYCENGQYLVSIDSKPLFLDKTAILMRNEAGEMPLKNINRFLKEEAFVEAVYEPNKALCLALTCGCEDFITVKSIKLKTEKILGYLNNFKERDSDNYLNFSTAEWLTSLDGTCTMIEDKQNFPDLPECNYNGFLIVKNNLEKTVKSSPNLEIFMQTLNHTTSGDYLWDEKISFIKFKQIIENPQTDHEKIYQNLPFWFEIENSEIKKITEQYLP